MKNQGQVTGWTYNETTNQPDRRFQHTCNAVPCLVDMDMRWANGDVFIIRSGRIQGSAPAGCEPCDGQWSRSLGRWVGRKNKICRQHRRWCTATLHVAAIDDALLAEKKTDGQQAQRSTVLNQTRRPHSLPRANPFVHSWSRWVSEVSRWARQPGELRIRHLPRRTRNCSWRTAVHVYSGLDNTELVIHKEVAKCSRPLWLSWKNGSNCQRRHEHASPQDHCRDAVTRPQRCHETRVFKSCFTVWRPDVWTLHVRHGWIHGWCKKLASALMSSQALHELPSASSYSTSCCAYTQYTVDTISHWL